MFVTADLHGRVERLPEIAAYVGAERARRTDAVLLVDAGDFFQGTPEGDLTRGRVVIDAFNAMGVDALVVGNHDFDPGPKVTEELARAARFPFLAANVGAPWVRRSLVRPDLRLEILGLAPDAMDRLSSRRARDGLKFTSAAKALTSHAWAPGCARLVLSHLGLERDRALPANGVAAILGGHTHVEATETLPGGTLLLHPGSHGNSIGRLELEIDPATGAVRSARGAVVPVPEGRDENVERLIEEATGDIRRRMAERVGRLEEDLDRGGPEYDGTSSPLGNHVADLTREAAGAECAVILRSSIRASLFRGDVRRRDLYEATPFPDTVVAVTLTGARLRSALERSIGPERLLVEVSGIEMSYSGKRIVKLEIAGVPLDPARRYRIATLSFMAEPGGFLSGRDLRDTGRTLFDLLTEFFRRRSSFRAPDFRTRIRRQ